MTDDRFIELLLKDLSGELHQEEQEEFQVFLNNEDYQKRYKIYKMYWSEHGRSSIDNNAMFRKVKQKISESGADEEEANQPVESRARAFRFSWWQSVAALLFIALSSVLAYRTLSVNERVEKTGWTVKRTERASKISFSLPDGSRITLNSDSKLRFPHSFSGKTREVYLSGEAFFDVKKDPSHPFIIHAGKMNVRVLGTAFNVKAYPNEPTAETTLIRGAVEVTLKERPDDKIILKPTEKLIVDYSLPKLEANAAADQDERLKQGNALTQITYMQKQDTTIVETSWVQHKLIFKNEDFAEVGRNMERWFNMDIHFANDELKKLRFSATFENESIDQALNALQVTDPFHYRIEGRSVYIY